MKELFKLIQRPALEILGQKSPEPAHELHTAIEPTSFVRGQTLTIGMPSLIIFIILVRQLDCGEFSSPPMNGGGPRASPADSRKFTMSWATRRVYCSLEDSRHIFD